MDGRRDRHHRRRPQDPFYISEEDKKIMREELFPFWKGKSVDEYCEDQYREAGVWELSGESFVSDCSYHALNGGGDSNPGYDVILMKKGMLDIQQEAREHLEQLDYENPDDIEKIYFYKSIIDTTEGVMIYARRMSEYAAELAAKEQNPRRREELLKISQVNARVPAHKPETFWEAIQAVWTIESLLVVEENQTGMSIGRVDQYMYPFYKGDIESGRLNDRPGLRSWRLHADQDVRDDVDHQRGRFQVLRRLPALCEYVRGRRDPGRTGRHQRADLPADGRGAPRADLPAFTGLPHPQQVPEEVFEKNRGRGALRHGLPGLPF